jgi:type II secretory pathway pseudopilin PulG
MIKSYCKKTAGNSIISMAIFLVVLGILTMPVISYYNSWKKNQVIEQTQTRLAAVTKAVKEYAAANGRYPCPAPLTSPLSDPNFGREIVSECNASAATAGDLTKQSISTKMDGATTIPIPVRAGAVPVRTLGLPDEYALDGYRSRLVYTVTEGYAKNSPIPDISDLDNNSMSGIFIEDPNSNQLTRDVGNVIFTVISLGESRMGAYNMDGSLIAACDPSALEGRNCDLDGHFVNTINKSDGTNPNSRFAQDLSFESTQPCDAKDKTPRKIAYLLDSSGSMGYRINESLDWDNAENCPTTGRIPSACSRMHTAQWAIRRALKARQYVMIPEKDPDGFYETYFSGFRGFDPQAANFANTRIRYDTDIESRLENMCPVGGTPLGDSILALADLIGNGEPDRPNKIIVISDGEHGGTSSPADNLHRPEDVLPAIKAAYPYLIVDLVNIGDNPAIESLIEENGGTFETSYDPNGIVDFLMKSSNNCQSLEVSEPANERYYCPANSVAIPDPNDPNTPTDPGTALGYPPGYTPSPIALEGNINVAACGGFNTSYHYRYYRMPIQISIQNPPPGYSGPIAYRNATLQGNLIYDDPNNPGSEGVMLSVTFKGVTYCLSGGRLQLTGDYSNLTMYSDGRYTVTNRGIATGTDTFYPRAIITRDGP